MRKERMKLPLVTPGMTSGAKYTRLYGINFVPIKMNVIFQETYESIN